MVMMVQFARGTAADDGRVDVGLGHGACAVVTGAGPGPLGISLGPERDLFIFFFDPTDQILFLVAFRNLCERILQRV